MKIKVVNKNEQTFFYEDFTNVTSLILSLLSLNFGRIYNIVIEHEGCVDTSFLSELLSQLSEDSIFEIKDVFSSDLNTTIMIEYRDRGYSYEKWDDERYIQLLKPENIKDFNFEIKGKKKTVVYLTKIFNMLRENYRENLITKNLFIALQLISNIIENGEEILFIVGDFDVVKRDTDDEEITFGLSQKVESQFLSLIKAIFFVDKEKSKLEYSDKKVYLNLVFKDFVFNTNEEEERND